LDVVGVAEDESGEPERCGDFGDFAARDVQPVEVAGPQVQVCTLLDVDRYMVQAGAVLLEALVLMSRVVIEPDVEVPVWTMQKHGVSAAQVVRLNTQALEPEDAAIPRLTGRHVAHRETHVMDATEGRDTWRSDMISVAVSASDHEVLGSGSSMCKMILVS
jgi:hypothetical protein